MTNRIEDFREKHGEEELLRVLSMAVRAEKDHESDELSAAGEEEMVRYLTDRLGPVGLVDALESWV